MTDARAQTGRLVVVSNRIADERPPAGGLVFALHECLSHRGGLWIGSAAETTEAPAERLKRVGGSAYQRMTFDLTEADHAQFYLGFANSVLWPLFHGRTDLIEMRADHFEGYARVNARLARQIAQELQPDDMLWIHDYHFLPLAHELRKLGVENRIGFFLHIPFPSTHDLQALSQSEAMVTWLAAFDLIGLQTQRDVAKALAALRENGAAEILIAGRVRLGEREVRIMSMPIGIDADAFAEAAEGNGLPALQRQKDVKLAVGVDRLDYSKGLVQRFRGFGAYLDARQDGDPRATLIQIAPESRGAVTAYQDIREELERVTGSINGAHSELDWTPIRYMRRNVDRSKVAPLLRRADIGLVTPLADGMNLVAKEFVAAQDPEDPGVLVLSHQAGASEQMEDAVLVNPYDPADMVAAIRAALTMPLAERRARHERLREAVWSEDIKWWTRTFLDALSAPVATGPVRRVA